MGVGVRVLLVGVGCLLVACWFLTSGLLWFVSSWFSANCCGSVTLYAEC